MATPPVFSAGAVLTAAQMNKVGMWLITPSSVTNGTLSGSVVTINSAVTSVTVNGVFSADFDQYQIVLANTVASAGCNMAIQYGSTTTGYYGSQYYDFYSGTPTGTNRINNGSYNLVLALGTVADTGMTITVSNPYAAARTIHYGNYFGGGYSGWTAGQLANTTSYTGFKFVLDTGANITGGTIKVYGLTK